MLTIFATDGTPASLMRNNMYTPGGARLPLGGAVALTLVLPIVSLSG
jgi:hypothetical protein